VNPPRVLNFSPYYLAADHQGNVYATDAEGAVIRVFGADGSLHAKLWPALASWQGPPGPGYSPPGPVSDPERLGLGTQLYQTGNAATANLPALGRKFTFCGIALDGADHLYVPDIIYGKMLRFAPDGRLDVQWALPAGYYAPLDCVATGGQGVFLGDRRGTVLSFSTQGTLLNSWTLPEQLTGGIAATRDGTLVYALTQTHIYKIETRTGTISNWELSDQYGAGRGGFQAIVVLPTGRLLVGNTLNNDVQVYCPNGQKCGYVGRSAAELGQVDLPGQLSQLGSIASDPAGRIYVADMGHRVIQRFTSSGHINALYWSIEDDGAD
jgi:sugar lactone lactonase YvrE